MASDETTTSATDRQDAAPTTEPDDRALVAKAQRGDRAAFRTLVERYQRRIHQLALGMLKDPDEAMDIAQETFVRVHQHLPAFKGDSSFFTWTYRIASNLCLDRARKLRRAIHVDQDDVSEAELEAALEPPSGAFRSPLGAVENRQLGEQLSAALATLSENHRAILLLREVDGLSYEELSQVLGIPKGTVMSRLFHARLKMQAQLRDAFGGEGQEGEQP